MSKIDRYQITTNHNQARTVFMIVYPLANWLSTHYWAQIKEIHVSLFVSLALCLSFYKFENA